MRRTTGSNQHEPKIQWGSSKKFLLSVFVFMSAISAGIDWYHNSLTSYTLYAQDVESASLPTTTPTPQVEITISGERGDSLGRADSSQVVGEMEQIVIDTFGEHADKAFQLLECENRSLNPNALNDNTEWGGVGKDYGLFQLNDHWQGIRHEGKAKQFLYDPEINARIAWRLYEDSGYSFNLWTCGKNLNI